MRGDVGGGGKVIAIMSSGFDPPHSLRITPPPRANQMIAAGTGARAAGHTELFIRAFSTILMFY